MSVLKKSIYVKGMKKWKYITTEHNFDDKLCLTVLSLMYPTILFHCYSPLDFDLFIYKFDSDKQEKVIARTHIYENSINATNIFLIKKQIKKKNRTCSMLNTQQENISKII